MDPQRQETPEERADRNFAELLQELRVTETGVAILFSLLLTVPFSARFDDVTEFQRKVYFAALLLTAAANVVLIAPVSFHRLLFQTGEKPRVVAASSVLAIVGLGLFVLSVTAVLLLISDVLFETGAATAVAAVFGSLTALLWFLPPLVQRLRRR